MNPLERKFSIEITVDQACCIKAALGLAVANCQEWLDVHPKSENRASVEKEIEKLEEIDKNIWREWHKAEDE